MRCKMSWEDAAQGDCRGIGKPAGEGPRGSRSECRVREQGAFVSSALQSVCQSSQFHSIAPTFTFQYVYEDRSNEERKDSEKSDRLFQKQQLSDPNGFSDLFSSISERQTLDLAVIYRPHGRSFTRNRRGSGAIDKSIRIGEYLLERSIVYTLVISIQLGAAYTDTKKAKTTHIHTHSQHGVRLD